MRLYRPIRVFCGLLGRSGTHLIPLPMERTLDTGLSRGAMDRSIHRPACSDPTEGDQDVLAPRSRTRVRPAPDFRSAVPVWWDRGGESVRARRRPHPSMGGC